MTCYHRMTAYRSILERTPTGKSVLTWGRPPAGPYEELKLPCKQCVGCRLDKSRDWALRCVHEASLWPSNAFVTLTYNDECIPEGETLVPEDYQKWMKRLREYYRASNSNIRFFMCGEYGSKDNRPHYHALLFNHEFGDQYYWMTHKGNKIYRSETLEKLWPFGFSWIGSVTWQSAAYVARYVLKKANGQLAFDRYVKDVNPDTGECTMLEPEFIRMSRRPGIGKKWYEKYRDDCRKDYLTQDGNTFRVPRYYDDLLEVEDVEEFNRRKNRRKEYARKKEQPDGLRLRQLEKHKMKSIARLERSL